MKQLYEGTLMYNGITVNCYYSISTTMNATYWNDITANPLNYLNVFTSNVGYMYSDVFNLVTNNWQT